MNTGRASGTLIAALLLSPAIASAVPIVISGSGPLGNFTGTFDFVASDDMNGVVSISLTNTSPAANGGFITAFVFNIPDGATLTSATVASSDGDFDDPGDLLGEPSFNNSVNGSPFGRFDIGASIGGSFQGGGPPSEGIGVGTTATFTFTLVGLGISGLTPDDFLNTFSVTPGAGAGVLNFVVRFRGFNDGGSDKVLNQVAVPEPATNLLFGLGIAALLMTIHFGARRSR